jgi:hypothetical protein
METEETAIFFILFFLASDHPANGRDRHRKSYVWFAHVSPFGFGGVAACNDSQLISASSSEKLE